MDKKDLNKIIDRYLEGKASQEDIKILSQFEDFAEDRITLNENEEVKNQSFNHISDNVFSNKNSSTYRPLLKYAAIFIILICSGIFGYLYFNNSNNQEVIANKTSQPMIIGLSDGTKVTLDKNTTITYSKNDFNIEERKITLQGKAFFEVSHNEENPFIVKTGDLDTKVTGTAFDITTSSEEIRVTVSEGSVSVFNDADTLNLIPNQQAYYSKNNRSLMSKTVYASNYDYWAKDIISLKNISMHKLTGILNDIYDVNFVYKNDELKNTKMTLSFNKNEGIENVIKIINQLNNYNLEQRNDKTITIKIKK